MQWHVLDDMRGWREETHGAVPRVKDCHQCDASDSFHLVHLQWSDFNTFSQRLAFDVHFERQQKKCFSRHSNLLPVVRLPNSPLYPPYWNCDYFIGHISSSFQANEDFLLTGPLRTVESTSSSRLGSGLQIQMWGVKLTARELHLICKSPQEDRTSSDFSLFNGIWTALGETDLVVPWSDLRWAHNSVYLLQILRGLFCKFPHCFYFFNP